MLSFKSNKQYTPVLILGVLPKNLKSVGSLVSNVNKLAGLPSAPCSRLITMSKSLLAITSMILVHETWRDGRMSVRLCSHEPQVLSLDPVCIIITVKSNFYSFLGMCQPQEKVTHFICQEPGPHLKAQACS